MHFYLPSYRFAFEKPLVLLVLLFSSNMAFSQLPIDHWETVIYADDIWKYRPGNTEPPLGWQNSDFNDAFWSTGEGGIGYGDGDDQSIIAPVNSLYLRKLFEISDLTKISGYLLHADYDDAFVAFINGVEVARANINTPNNPPLFDDVANSSHEALIYQGGSPESFILDYSLMQSILHEGENVLAIQVHNRSLTSSDLSAIFYLSLGINDENQYYGEVHDHFDPPLASSNLPLLIINTDSHSTIISDIKSDGHLGIIDNGTGIRNYLSDPFNGYNGRMGIEIKGSSSTMFPKKNYSIETRDSLGENNNVKLLGMPKENDWILHGPYSDKTLIRNALSYHIGGLTGQYTPRYRFCEVMINDNYQGVYILTEKIKRDENRVDIDKMTPDDIAGDELTGGYLIKKDRNNPDKDNGWTSDHSGNVFYAYVEPKYDEIISQQKQYIQNYFSEFENEVKNGNVSNAVESFIDIPSFVDYWIATEIFKHIDGWKFSFYMYKRKDSNGGKLHMGPLWDLNLAYGNSNFGFDVNPQGWSYIWANTSNIRPFWVPMITDSPEVSDAIACRWTELRQNKLSTDSLMQYLDETYVLLEEARRRNFKRWDILGNYVWPNDFVGQTYDEEYDFLTNWLLDRLVWMDNNMVGNCTTDTEEVSLNSSNITLFPNPASEGKLFFFFTNRTIANSNIRIYNELGELLLNKQIQSNMMNSIDIVNLSSGLYYYQLFHNYGTTDSGVFIVTNQ